MKEIILSISGILLLIFFPIQGFGQTIDVLIKGVDDGIKTTKQRDYLEAVMNAKLQAIERAGVEIRSITVVENFQLKYDLIENKAGAVLLPGFQIIDMGYQTDGTYQVVLSGKVQVGSAKVQVGKKQGPYWGKLRSNPIKIRWLQMKTLWGKHNSGQIKNDFEDNKDGTITDRATGLMWIKKANLGDPCFNTLKETIHKNLNYEKFAGYSDWRLPTVEEIGSIVTSKPMSRGKTYTPNPTYFIDPIFAPPYVNLWIADTTDYTRHGTYFRKLCPPDEYKSGWNAGVMVNFFNKEIYAADFEENIGIKAVRSMK